MKVKSTILILYLCIKLVNLQANSTSTSTSTTEMVISPDPILQQLNGWNDTINMTSSTASTTTQMSTTTRPSTSTASTSTTMIPQEARFPIAKSCQNSGRTGDCAIICVVLLAEKEWPITLIVLYAVEAVALGVGGLLLTCLVCKYRSPKQQRPTRPIRTAEPLNHIAEGAIDPVMSPAPDEVDAEGQIIVAKTKFDKNSPDVRLKHRQYMEFMRKQERSDADSKKFKKCAPIFIPAFVDDAQFAKKCEDPDNIILENVVYDPSGNELYEIGSDVDNIELNPSSILTLTEDSQKASTMKTMKAPKTAMMAVGGSATQLKSVAQLKTANLKSSKKSRRMPKNPQGVAAASQQPKSLMTDKKSLVEKSFLS